MEIYARSYCTENEHEVLENMLQQYCKEHNLIINYYRKLKSGHQSMWREWKISGSRGEIFKLSETFKGDINNEWRS